MNPEIKYSLIEKLIQTEDDELLNKIKNLLEGFYDYSEEHKQLVNESLSDYRSNPQKTETWDEVKR